MSNNLRASPNSKAEARRKRDIKDLAEYLKSNKCKKVVLMLGAGVSTSAGIPDFRSPKTGLYANLARLNLPQPEAVFEINFFRRNPVPFYTLASELYPGAFRPTPTHSFIKLLHDNSLLHMCFTQNIDTLERRAGVPEDKIIEAHGSFASHRCIDCKEEFPDDVMKEIVLGPSEDEETDEEKKPMGRWEKRGGIKIPRCMDEECNGLVKPEIVFFGEGLPTRFIKNINLLSEADALIIMGTSLTVHPFASLAGMASPSCKRVLINLERVGDIGRKKGDVVLLGDCDSVVKELAEELGWKEDLDKAWAETEGSVEVKRVDQVKEKRDEEKKKPPVDKQEAAIQGAKDEVEKIVEAMSKKLDLKDGQEKEQERGKVEAKEAKLPPGVEDGGGRLIYEATDEEIIDSFTF